VFSCYKLPDTFQGFFNAPFDIGDPFSRVYHDLSPFKHSMALQITKANIKAPAIMAKASTIQGSIQSMLNNFMY
jgi:hypothetical protein